MNSCRRCKGNSLVASTEQPGSYVPCPECNRATFDRWRAGELEVVEPAAKRCQRCRGAGQIEVLGRDAVPCPDCNRETRAKWEKGSYRPEKRSWEEDD